MMSLTLQRRGLVDEYNGYQFRRESMAQDSAGKLIYPHNARFESGPFGSDKAILVEEGTENKIATPTTFAGWRLLSGGAVLDNDGSFYPSQAKFARVTTPLWSFESNSIPAANGQTWSVSYIARRGTGDGEPRAAIMIMNASNKHVGNINLTFSSRNIGGGWVRYEATFTINHADTGYICLRFYVTATNGGYHDFALPQLEQKPYATTFTPSVRADESLTVPIEGLLSPEQGTIELWYNDNGINKNKIVFKCGDLKFNPVSVTKGWHLISVIWDGVDTNYYIDKELVSTTNSPTELGSLYLGSDGDIDFINSLISHLRLSSIARTADQLAPLDAPPTVDEYTTLYVPFNGADGVRAAKVVTL